MSDTALKPARELVKAIGTQFPNESAEYQAAE